MPGYVTYCVGIPNITVDVRYDWNGVLYETDNGVTFDSNGCAMNYYGYDGFAGAYTFTGIRNSANGPYGAFSPIYTQLTLYPAPQPPSISSFYAEQNPIKATQGTYLNWESSNASYAYLNGQYVGASGWQYVNPGSTTTYTLTVYNSNWQQASSSLTLIVNPLNQARFVTQSVPPSMLIGGVYSVSVTMQNTGTTTWTAGDSYQLGSQNPQDNTTWGLSRVSLPANVSVAPNSQYAFNFAVTAPSTVGSSNFQWKMIQSGVEWFDAQTINVPVAVSVPPPPPQPTSMSFSPASVNAGNGNYTLTVGSGAGMSLV